MAPILVVITGKGGSGKTTLARTLARPVGATVLSKDLIKEALHEPLQLDTDEASLAGSIAAMRLLYSTASMSWSNLIVEANWKPFDAEQLRALGRRTVQIVCSAPSDVLRERVLARIDNGERHAVHRDGFVPAVRAGLLASLTAAVEPLALDCPTLELDTTAPVDVAAVVNWVETSAGRERHSD